MCCTSMKTFACSRSFQIQFPIQLTRTLHNFFSKNIALKAIKRRIFGYLFQNSTASNSSFKVKRNRISEGHKKANHCRSRRLAACQPLRHQSLRTTASTRRDRLFPGSSCVCPLVARTLSYTCESYRCTRILASRSRATTRHERCRSP